MTFSPISAFFVLPVMLVLIELGRRFRIQHKAPQESTAIENAIFALFGLLLAFTFSGAVERYDRQLPPAAQPALRQLFRDYTNSRLHLYDTVSDEVSPATEHLQRDIWQQSVAAATAPGANVDATKILLPALNTMIDITATRRNAFNMHPPQVVFLLLFVFSGGAAFLGGYSMAVHGRSWFHMFALALAVTLTIYATLEIEYPRRGLIRLTDTDKTLIELRNSMN
jgi:hypothetical protein